MRTRPRPCYNKVCNLSTRTGNISNMDKGTVGSDNKTLKDVQINKLLPIINKMIQLPAKPIVPIHIGKAISGELR